MARPPMKKQPSLAETGKALGEVIVASMQRQQYRSVSPEDLHNMLTVGEPVTIVDCRAADDYDEGHVPGAINVPFQRFMDDHTMVPKNGRVLAYCYVGVYSRAAAQKLATSGHATVMSLEGGWAAWDEYKNG